MGVDHWQIEEFAEIDSTNLWLVQRAREGAAPGLVARADFQSAGRGRLDRTWEAKAGSSLLTSILLEPELATEDLHLCSVAVALSARDALVRLCGLRPSLKWPNDLVVDDKKLGGLLAEAVTTDTGRTKVVVGIGLNLTYSGPPDANGTSVLEQAGVTVAARAALDLLLDELDQRVELLNASGAARLRDEYESALSTLGRRVRVERASDEIVGIASGVDGGGRLVVDVNGAQVTVAVGDVVHLRAAED